LTKLFAELSVGQIVGSMLSSDSSRLKRSQKVVFYDHVVKDQMDRKNLFTFCLISLMETGGVSAIARKHQVWVH
jgi:hypothetical protein